MVAQVRETEKNEELIAIDGNSVFVYRITRISVCATVFVYYMFSFSWGVPRLYLQQM